MQALFVPGSALCEGPMQFLILSKDVLMVKLIQIHF